MTCTIHLRKDWGLSFLLKDIQKIQLGGAMKECQQYPNWILKLWPLPSGMVRWQATLPPAELGSVWLASLECRFHPCETKEASEQLPRLKATSKYQEDKKLSLKEEKLNQLCWSEEPEPTEQDTAKKQKVDSSPVFLSLFWLRERMSSHFGRVAPHTLPLQYLSGCVS